MTPLSEGPEIQKCTEGFLKTPVSAQGPLQHPPGSAAPGLRVHWPAGIWGQPGISSPAASRWLSGSLYSSIDPSPDASACCTGARLRGGARSPAPPQPSGKQPPQPSSASVPGLCPAPGTVRPGPEAGRGPVRRPLSRGGEETQGDQEEEQERVKERRRSGRRGRRRAGPTRPCPAQPRWRPRPAGPPNPRLPLHLRPRCGAEARLRGAGARRSRCCSRLAFGPGSCEPSGRHVAAAAEPARICNSSEFFFFWGGGVLRARGNLGSTPRCFGPLFPCKLRLPRGNIKGFREGRGAESQSGTRDLPAPSGQP